MSLTRYYIPPAFETDVKFEPCESEEQSLEKKNHQHMAVVLAQLGSLLDHAAQMFTEISDDITSTSDRISNLNTRAGAAASFLPQLESYVETATAETFQTAMGYSDFRAETVADAGLFAPKTRHPTIQDHYKNRCVAPPNVGLLDEIREDKQQGLKLYTNPAFFIEEWIEEQRRRTKHAKKRRKKRRKERADQAAAGGVVHRNQELANVSRLKRTRYNQWGEKIEDEEDDSAYAAPSRAGNKNNTPHVRATAAPESLTRAERKAQKKAQKEASKAKRKLRASTKGKSKSKKKHGHTHAHAGASDLPTPPQPVDQVPPPPVRTAPSIPKSPRGKKTQQVSSSHQPASMSPPHSPRGATEDGPPPPPPPSGAGLSVPKEPENKKSDLLMAIQAKKLRKVEEDERKRKPAAAEEDATVNVAAILARRIAMEFSDSEDDEGEDWDDEWDD